MYDVFISYNRNDKVAAEHFARLLAALQLRVYFDTDALLPASPWREELAVALRESRAVAVLLGPTGLGRTQNQEEQFTLAERERRGVLLFRVMLPGAEEPRETSFAGLNTYVDLRSGIDNREELRRIELALRSVHARDPRPGPVNGAATHARPSDVDDAVQATVRRLGSSGLTFLVGGSLSLAPSASDMAQRLSERLRENDPSLPAIPWLDVAGTYYAVDRDDELAVELEITALLEAAPPGDPHATYEELARLARQVHDRLAPRVNGQHAQGQRQPFKQAVTPLLIVTTNFDLHVERALIRASVPFRRVVQFSSEPRLDVADYAPTLQGDSIAVDVRDHLGRIVASDLFGKNDGVALNKVIGAPVEPIRFAPGTRAKQSKNPLSTLPLSGPGVEGAQVIVYKPYGSQDLSGSCAISCDHHYRFALKSVPEGWIPTQIITTLQNSTLVVLGYSFFDPGYRLVSHTLLVERGTSPTSPKWYVVRGRPDGADGSLDSQIESALWADVKRAWSKKAIMLDVPETDFLRLLRESVARDLSRP